MEFVLVGDLKMPENEIEKMIKKFGGKLVTEIHSKVAAIISTKKEVKKMRHEMILAKDNDIQVISEDFLNRISSVDVIDYIIGNSICDWGDNVSFNRHLSVKTQLIS